jgi:RND family efflux transporter MFP subunit
MIFNIWSRVRQFFVRMGWKKNSLLLGAVVILFVIGITMLRGSTPASVPTTTTPGVTLDTVSNLSEGGSSLSIAGVVQSQTEATVRAEKSGKVTSLHYALGSSVSAGAVIAELENASERAAVLQAQGAAQAATAGANVSQTTLAGAKGASVTALLSAYATVDTTVRGSIDPMFSNPESAQPQFTVASANSQAKIDAESKRSYLSPLLTREHARVATLSTSDDLISEFTKAESELRVISDFFDTVIVTLNAGIATNGISEPTLATYKATATGARASITAALSSMVSARQSLQTALQNSATGSDTASASQAALTQAQGTLAAARANLEHSIIRAPISGTINSLTLKLGDFVQAGSPVVTVANNHALEVLAYITANDAAAIAVGSKATIQETTEGVVTRIAPAIDPLTKKIEVRIGITKNTSLINGQSVSVVIKGTTQKPNTTLTRLTIPLTALKIGAEGMSVFTVSASSTLEAHIVKIGELLGDRVVITEGVTPEMTIVTDARGLRSGETVTVR